MKKSIYVIFTILILIMSTATAIINIPVDPNPPIQQEGNEIKRTQVPEYIEPTPEPEFTITINGEPQTIEFIQVLSELPEYDYGKGIPLYSLIFPSGIYKQSNPNDINSPILLYGSQIWVFLRFSLFSGHNATLEGTITYHMNSGGDWTQELYLYAQWVKWQPFMFPVRAYRLTCCDYYPLSCLISIDYDMYFYEDGRLICHIIKTDC